MINNHQLNNINWKKVNGLIPCIIQNIFSSEVLMHGYMNQKALYITQKKKIVTFYSRTKKRLWKKGEISGNILHVMNIILDCDYDSLLILVQPKNKTCHLNNDSCFTGEKTNYTNFFNMEKILKNKKHSNNISSYTFNLHRNNINRIVQKLGEEAIEVIISAIDNNKRNIINETSDLIYHLLVLLHYRHIDFNNIIHNLNLRHKKFL